MILGIGTDIVAVSRIRAVCERRGDRFARRILHAGEWPGYRDAADPARLLARRFAAKEAVAKALGTGFRAGVGPSQIEVVHDAQGRRACICMGRPQIASRPAARRACGSASVTSATTRWPTRCWSAPPPEALSACPGRW